LAIKLHNFSTLLDENVRVQKTHVYLRFACLMKLICKKTVEGFNLISTML